MTPEEKVKRGNSARLKKLTITKYNDAKPYVFVSYKSDDWRDALEEVVFRLQKEFGLRIYYDKDFEHSNNSWRENMEKHINSVNCVGVLALFSRKYVSSYATLMEIMKSQSDSVVELSRKEKPKSIIPVALEKGDLETYIDDAMATEQFKPTGIKQEEWATLVKIMENCTKTKNPQLRKVCDRFWKHEEESKKTENQKPLLKEPIILSFSDLLPTIVENEPTPRENSDYLECIKDRIKEVQESCNKNAFDPALICLEDLNIPMTDQEATEAVSAPDPVSAPVPTPVPIPEPVSAPVPAPVPAPEHASTPAAKPKRAPRAAKPLDLGSLTPRGSQVTIGQVRARMSQQELAAEFRAVREGMPYGGKGAMDYAMAAILGGCNQVTVKSPDYQIFYYTQVVASLDAPKKGSGLGATWTWSSMCSKVLETADTRAIPKETNDYFRSLPESTTLGELEQKFFEAGSSFFQTKKNDLVIIGLQRVMEFMES